MTDWNALVESALSREERRRRGVFNTPLDVARDIVATLIDRPGTVCDPSCGAGTFLIAAAERLVELGLSRAEAVERLVGVDVDPAAIAVAEQRIAEWSDGGRARLLVGDGLAFEERFDFVVGNPPFVDRLHARFLEHAIRLGDAVGMIVPTSLLATNDGRAARSSGYGVESVTRLGPVFDAAVDTCALVLRPGAPVPAGPTWASLLAGAIPDVRLVGEPLGATCEVVAGFRQHYYGLRGHVREGGDGLPLVTSGSIDPGVWGGRPVRFDGTRWEDPRVSLDGVDEPVASWFRALLRPKVVVATQTRVIEAAADERGEVVPSVPVISVVPHDPARLWHVLAVLLSPPVSAWAIRSFGGTALSAGAVKLGCPHVRDVPMPAPSAAWDAAAALLAAGGDVVEAGRLMCDAYDVGEEVHRWWVERRR